MADNNKKKYIKYEDTTYILEDSRIPDPSSADNGKVLGIVNGAYALKQEQGGGGEGTVKSVNNIEPDANGDVALGASDVHALPDSTVIPAAVTEQTVAGWGFTKNTGTYSKPSGGIPASDLAAGVIPVVPQMATAADMSDWTSGKTVDAAVLKADYMTTVLAIDDLSVNKANKTEIPTKVSDLTNDSGFQTAAQVQSAIAAAAELPSVTASDNGKFLRVVNGAWAAESVPAAEGSAF